MRVKTRARRSSSTHDTRPSSTSRPLRFGARGLTFDLQRTIGNSATSRLLRAGLTQPKLSEDCAKYEPNEIKDSRTQQGHLSTDVFLGSMSQLNKKDHIVIADFGVDRGSVKDSAKAEPFLQQWIDTFENDPDYWLEIEGYSDCVGVEHHNDDLRHRRATKVFQLFDKARSRVRFHKAAPANEYLLDNGDVLRRSINRGVTIHFGKLSPPKPVPSLLSRNPSQKSPSRSQTPTTAISRSERLWQEPSRWQSEWCEPLLAPLQNRTTKTC